MPSMGEVLHASVKTTGAERTSAQLANVGEQMDDLGKNRRGRVTISVNDRQVTQATAKVKALDTKLAGLQGTAQKLQGLKLGGQGLTMALGIPAAISAIGPLVGGVNALGAGAVALVAPLQQATSLIAAIPGMVLPAAGAFGTFKLATLGVGDAIKESVKLSGELGDAMASGDTDAIDKAKKKIDQLTASMEDKFAPAALDFIGLMPLMQVEMQELGKQLQPGLFKGATAGLMGFRNMLREITPELGMISGAMGDAARSFGVRVSGADFTADLKANMLGAVTLISTMSDAIGNLLSDFVQLGAKAQPVLGRVNGTIMRISGAVSNWADAMTDAKFQKGYETFQTFWQILRNTWSALGGVLRAFQPLGDWLWDTLNRLTLEWTRWTNSITGQNSLKEWADSSKPVLIELGKLLGAIGDMWTEIADPEGMGDGLRLLREELIPALTDIFKAANETGIFENLIASLGNLATILATVFGTSGVFGLALEGLVELSEMAANLIDSVPVLGSAIANLATAFTLLKIIGIKGPIGMGLAALVMLSDQFTGSLKPLIPLVIGLGVAFAGWKLLQLAGQLSTLWTSLRLVGPGMTVLSASGKNAQNAFIGLSGAAQALGTSTAVLSGGLIAITAAIAAGFMVWQAWQTNVKRTRDEIEALNNSVLDGTTASKAYEDYLQNIIDTRDGYAEATAAIGMNSKELSAIIAQTGDEFDALRNTVDKVTWDDFTEGVKASQDVANVPFAVNNLALQWQSFWNTMTNDAGDWVDAMKESDDAVVRIFGSRVDELRDSGKLTDDQINKLKDLTAEASLAREALEATLKVDVDKFQSVASRLAAPDLRMLNAAEATGDLDAMQEAVSRLAAKYPWLTDELKIMTDAGLGASAMFEEQTKAMNAAKAELDKYYDGLGKIVAGRDLITTEDDLIKKQIDLTKRLKENKGEWSRNTEAGLAHRDAIREIEQAVLDQADAMMAAGGSVDAAKGKWDDFVRIIEDLQKKGLVPANVKAEEFLTTLGMTEGVWTAEIELKWKDEAYKDLQLLESLVNSGGGGAGATKAYQIAVTALMTGDTAAFERAIALGKWAALDPEGTVKVNFTGSDADLKTMIRTLAAQGIAKGDSLEATAWYLGVGLQVPPPAGFPTIMAYLESLFPSKKDPVVVPVTPSMVPNPNTATNPLTWTPPSKELWVTPTLPTTGATWWDVLFPGTESLNKNISVGADTTAADEDVNAWTPPSPQSQLLPGVSFGVANGQVNEWRPPVPDTKMRPQASFRDANRQVNEWRPPVPDTKMRPQVSFGDANRQVNEWRPPKVTITPVVGGLSAAMREAIDGLPKYTINIEGKVTAAAYGGINVGNGYPIQHRAMGGLPNQAKIQMPRANLIQWAEPETHGEAFIPLAPSKRGRSVAIWHETGKRLGVMAEGGINDSVQAQWSPMNFKDVKWTPPVDPSGGVGGAGGGPGSYQKIINYLNKLGIPFRNMGTWAYRNVAGTNRLSLHASGRAVDLGDPAGGSSTPALLRIYRALRAGMRLTELIYSGPGGSNPKNPITRKNHYDHVHAAMADGGITAFAKGGLVTKPTLGLLGEAGPELVVPLASGGITAYPGGKVPTMDVVSTFSSPEIQSAIDGLKKVMSATGTWTKFLAGLQRSTPAQAVQKIQKQSDQTTKYLTAVAHKLPVLKSANRGFSSDQPWAQAHEALTNEFEMRVSNLTKVDPDKAIAELSRAMREKGVAKWSNEWVAMTQRIESLQTQIATKQASKVMNKWEWEFEHAEASRQVAMAQQAAGTMEKWSDEWVAMMRRVEEAQQRNTGPAVMINEATFNDQADLDAFNSGIEWAIRTQRL